MIEVNKAKQQYISAIKKHVKDNFELWNEVPYWAAQAQGRTGYLDKYHLCYSYGIWQLDDYCFVDCGSGELVGWGSDGVYPAHDSFIVSLKLSSLNVLELLNDLREHTSKSISKYVGRPSESLLKAKQAPLKFKREIPVPGASYQYY